MSKAWMPMYWGDLIADTMHLGATEFGIYMRLLAHCWQHGSIPDNDRMLALISHCDTRLWHRHKASVLQFFGPACDAKMLHTRVTKELLRYNEISNQNRESALRMHEKKRANALLLQSQSPKKERIPTRAVNGHSLEFSLFWEAYPKKVDKGHAEKAFAKALKLTTAQSMVDAVKSQDFDPKFTKNPATWLNGQCWLDEGKPKPNVQIGDVVDDWVWDGSKWKKREVEDQQPTENPK